MPLQKLPVFPMFSMGTLGSPITIVQCYILGPAVIGDLNFIASFIADF